MKKLFALILALVLAMSLLTPAMAEAAENAESAVEEAVETTAETAEEAAESAEAEVADTAEAVKEEAPEEAQEAAEAEAADTAEAAEEEAPEEAQETAEEAAESAEAEVADSAEAVEEEASEDAQEDADEVSPIIKKLTELPWYTWVLLALLMATGIILALGAKKTTWNSRRIAMGAMCIAIAFVLSCIRLFRMPQGGSITPASMLPLVLFMVACGPLQGFVVGCAYGLLQLITDPYVIHPVQMLLDYPLASGAMILSCLAFSVIPERRKRIVDLDGNTTGYLIWNEREYRFAESVRLPLAVLFAGIGNYIMAVLSGAIFFAEYAGEQNAWIYSLTYNISYLGPNVIFCMLIACIPGMLRLVDMIAKKK